ncbi:hypothetical protein JCM10212_003804, partial [Sporobolomyces blumeae]
NAAISFIERLDASSLSNITQSEFETNVAKAVGQLASEEPPPPVPVRPAAGSEGGPSSGVQRDLDQARRGGPMNPTLQPTSQPEETLSASLVSEQPPQQGDPTSRDAIAAAATAGGAGGPKNFLLRSSDSVERAMSKPIGALAKIFEQLEVTANELSGQNPPRAVSASSDQDGPRRSNSGSSHHSQHLHHRRSLLVPPSPTSSASFDPSQSVYHPATSSSPRHPAHLPPSPNPALYADPTVSDASASLEIERQHEANLSTLLELFPSGQVEKEVVEMVLFAEDGDVGKSVERLLEMVAT